MRTKVILVCIVFRATSHSYTDIRDKLYVFGMEKIINLIMTVIIIKIKEDF